MPRSLRVRHESIATVKAAVHRSGFTSQRMLAEDLGMALSTVNNFLTGKPVDLAVFGEICRKLSLEPQQVAETEHLVTEQPIPTEMPDRSETTLLQDAEHDWGDAPDVSVFYDRVSELATLENWIRQDRCRLIAVLGMGGMGKTALSMKLAEQTQDEFERVIWRSLRNAPPVLDLLADLIRFLSSQQEINLPDNIDSCILRLIHYLRSQRCLLILDNAESVLQAGERSGRYLSGYEGYGQLFRTVGDTAHQSCLILTSREKPTGLTQREGKAASVRSFQLAGLSTAAGQEIVKQQELLSGTEAEWQMLVQHYAGNPLALKLAAPGVEDFFDGEIARFLQYASQGSLVFDDIRDLLKRQVSRLSELELGVMNWLAINREPVTSAELQADLGLTFGLSELLAALASLQRRSLIESGSAGFSQQPVVMEFITEQFLLHVYQELIDSKTPLTESLLRRYALVKATAKDYIRETQIRLILEPLIALSIEQLGATQKLKDRLRGLLDQFHQSQIPARYAVGNIFHLLHQLNADLTGLDLSGLQIWQADLSNVRLHQANLAQAQIAKSVFAGAFGYVLSVAFSPDGKWLAAYESNGTIQIWEVTGGRKMMTLCHHTKLIWFVAFAPHPQHSNQHVLVSAGSDQSKLWDLQTGECLQTLTVQGNIQALSPDGHWLAGVPDPATDTDIRLWNLQQHDQPPRILEGHSQRISSVAFSPTGQTLASGSTDGSIKLWDLTCGECYQTLEGYTSRRGNVITFSPDGNLLATSSDDHTIRIWKVFEQPSKRLILGASALKHLQGHTFYLDTLSFSPDSQYLISSGGYQTRLWDIATRQCLKTWPIQI